MGDHTAFFYGTLMAPQVLHRVCHGTSAPSAHQKSLLTVRPAVLHSYSRHKVRLCDYPAVLHASIAPCHSAASRQANTTVNDDHPTVRGTYVEGLTDGDIWRLDIFEGDEYKRKHVAVRILNAVGDDSGVGNIEGEEVNTQTYVWVAGTEKLEEGEWDFEDFVKEKMGRWVGTSNEYEEVDDAVRHGASDPTGGRGRAGQITEVLDKDDKAKKQEMLESAI